MRGLKLVIRLWFSLVLCRIFYRCVDWNSVQKNNNNSTQSHLLQMRGLKPRLMILTNTLICRIFYRCVDWNVFSSSDISRTDGRIFYRCVDWNGVIRKCNKKRCSRIFYRCVDWNMPMMFPIQTKMVASFTDAWIETLTLIWYISPRLSRIFYRCVDWNNNFLVRKTSELSRIFYRCVDWNFWSYF